MKAFVFPGQGAQFSGMGKDLYDASPQARARFEEANDILGFDIASIMFEGSDEELKQTKVTQPAIFLHSVILAECLGEAFQPDMVAGHSLGEFSALVAAGALSFADGLRLVSARANAMQKACELQPSTMAAVLGLDNDVVEDICNTIDGVVVAANYNCPGQLVISGEVPAVEAACAALSEAGARRALMLPVGGAFHSPLMEPAREELASPLRKPTFKRPLSHLPKRQCGTHERPGFDPSTTRGAIDGTCALDANHANHDCGRRFRGHRSGAWQGVAGTVQEGRSRLPYPVSRIGSGVTAFPLPHEKGPPRGWPFFVSIVNRSGGGSRRRFFTHLRCKGEQIAHLMLSCMQRFAQGAIFRSQIVVALLGARQLGLQSQELAHDRFAVRQSRLQLFFEQHFHGLQDSVEGP